jgi:hypothetical protein
MKPYRRVENLPEEQREIDDALARAATPMHQPTVEFDPPLVERPRAYMFPINTGIIKRILPNLELGDK